MGVLTIDHVAPCAFCGEEADYSCDVCGKLMCCECNAPMPDDCPNEFCEGCAV